MEKCSVSIVLKRNAGSKVEAVDVRGMEPYDGDLEIDRTSEELRDDGAKAEHSGSKQEEDSQSKTENNEPQAESEVASGTINDTLDVLKNYPDINVTISEKDVRITLTDRILFKLGVAEIDLQGLPALKKITHVIGQLDDPVRVEGHTDNLPINTARFPSNWELSIARGVNVVKYFITTGKLDPKRFSAVGYGDSRPLYSNDSPKGRAKNRRVEIVIDKQ